MTRPPLDPGPPATPRTAFTTALEQTLDALDAAASQHGRVLVLRSAERVAARVLSFINSREPNDDERIAGACMVLMSVAGDVLHHMERSAGWPVQQVRRELAVAIESLRQSSRNGGTR